MNNPLGPPGGFIKQGTNALMPVRFKGLNLDDVDHIAFVIEQFNVRWEFTYPSDTVSRITDTDDTVGIVWRESDTWRFDPKHDIKLDTRVYPTDAWQNPYTLIKTFRMDETLFKQESESGGDADG